MGRSASKQLQPDPPPVRKSSFIVVSFEKYSKGGDYCLSECEQRAVRGFADGLRILCSLTRQDLMLQSSKGPGKRGLNPTPYPDHALTAKRPNTIPTDSRIIGMRAGDDDRMFGYFVENVFFILWFDSHHRIVPV